MSGIEVSPSIRHLNTLLFIIQDKPEGAEKQWKCFKLLMFNHFVIQVSNCICVNLAFSCPDLHLDMANLLYAYCTERTGA